ncbi:activity-dependent neuroprotective protein a [Synchiropus splendidus]|uniref:activity-dependent neuroprotective protein a n=1 Tax=Synchiropus splendidus TaxID=270530 RepID=UPI00237DF101|nr:activity-dependent neuroprotective protein a [Synchiropus splendidus]
MYQLPVHNLTRIRKARRKVKLALGDIGLEFCKEASEDFKDFSPDDETLNETTLLDVCEWDPSLTKTQEYRSKPFCCTECSFSSKFYSGYKNHFRNVHRDFFESTILLNCPYCTFTASKKTLETHVRIFHSQRPTKAGYGAAQGGVAPKDKANPDRAGPKAAGEKAMYFCKKCTFRDTLYNVVRRHIYREHFKHIVSPYLGMATKSMLENGNQFNGNNILCKRCQFSTRNYEALVQHALEYHERIGPQVISDMIGHANILAKKQNPAITQKSSLLMNRGQKTIVEQQAQPVIGYIRPVHPVKTQSPIAAQKQATLRVNNSAPRPGTGVNTSQTQKWKICTVCNELFPENLYSAHFANAHKAKKVWALAKYIMKIHNFTSKCLVCNRYLPSDTLLNHMLIHGLTCPQCHSAFHSVEKLIEHVGQAHTTVFVEPAGAAPLTFDLTLKQGKSTNIQLLVLPFNVKDSVNGKPQTAPYQNSVSPVGKVTTTMMEKIEPVIKNLMVPKPKNDVGKTLCPLCFSILKGPVSEALAMHLRERHQVLQTMHPVEKKMTYKCIHCLGVYTSNMVASTITLHLVQCRAVGRKQTGHTLKSPFSLSSPDAGILKRQMPMHMTSNAKRSKFSKVSTNSPVNSGKQSDSVSLALDPSSHEQKPYQARKDFLTAYFNKRPYLSSAEEEKLSASLFLWKSDICGHFANKRTLCQRRCESSEASVLLGFDMEALQSVKHDMVFQAAPVGNSNRKRGGLKSGTPTRPCKQRKTANCVKAPVECTETICIESDGEPESPTNDEDKTQLEDVESKEATDLMDLTENTSMDEQESSLQDGKENAVVSQC